MATTYIQTVINPETDEEFELQLETGDDDGDDNIRNRRPTRPGPSIGGRPMQQGRFSLAARRDQQRTESRQQSVTQVRPASQASSSQPASTAGTVQNNGDYLTIRKDALLGLVSLGGSLWAAYHERPDMPETTGNRDVDFTNASMHRDALALHDQNRGRIRALSDLAERALRALRALIS